ncbi:MAG: SH3 domain-containing protein [Actinomycetota bacterium]|nr:MAG: hypothetical protein FD171_1657 [Actinomycetota bacterium]MDO8949942.1 SH3 domain-containing protein [Actinomycetota bacterium]MDP3631177.1 SH3 domain-containing protein [Actinomycetota bacterium]
MADMNSSPAVSARKALTIIGALFALGLVAWMVLNAYGDYRAAVSSARRGGSVDSTAGVEGTSTKSGGEGTGTVGSTAGVVTVLAEGLNLRDKPTIGSKSIKTLKKGDKLALVEKMTGWYKVRDAAGDEGWVAAGGQYSKLGE